MANNEVAILAECRGCGERFEVSATSGTTSFRKEYKDKDGQSIWLTYYDCPKCGKRHFVQADNRHSTELLKDVSKSLRRIAVAKRKGKAIPAAMQDKFKKQKRHLDEYRMELMKEWTGRVVTEVATDLVYELEFSV